MNLQSDTTRTYLAQVPLALAIERLTEVRLYKDKPFEAPVLDVGCGDGLFASIAIKVKIDVGIDPDTEELKLAHSTGTYKELIACSGSAIPKEDELFGTAFSNSVLEHIPDLRSVMIEVWRVLKPGGNFYITVPSDKFFAFSVLGSLVGAAGSRALEESYHRRYNNFWKHYHDFSLDDWRSLAQKCGYEVVEAFTYNRARNCRINDALVPLGALGKAQKLLLNRWVASPRFRHLTVGHLHKWVDRLVDGAGETQDGGLVFLWIRKPQIRA